MANGHKRVFDCVVSVLRPKQILGTRAINTRVSYVVQMQWDALPACRANVQRSRARAAAARGDVSGVETFLQRTPEGVDVYDWGINGVSTAVPFDRIMWRCALAHALRQRKQYAAAAKQLGIALRDEFTSWTARGVESRRVNEPSVYAMYCANRADAAIAALRQRSDASGATRAQFAAYAALVAGTAHVLQPALFTQNRTWEALGLCYEAHAATALKDDKVGHAAALLQEAAKFFALTQLPEPRNLSHVLDRNMILHEPQELPAPRADLIRPRTLGAFFAA